ncbi:MAG: type II toxin-antitoxin system Phd/YefM family antitoxin [Candidatus Dormibacteraceae bacterium]
MTISEVRARLPAVVDRVQRGERVTITRHGQPVAVIAQPDPVRNPDAEALLREADLYFRGLDAAIEGVPFDALPGLDRSLAQEIVTQLERDRERDKRDIEDAWTPSTQTS